MVVSSEKTASSSSTSLSDTTSVQIVTQWPAPTHGPHLLSQRQPAHRRAAGDAAVTAAGTVVKYLSTKSLSGTVSSDGAHFAGYPSPPA